MALFTDSPAIDIVDLTAYESSILETANAEGIDLTVKIGLAKEEAGAQLEGLTELEGVVVTAPLRLWQLFHTLALVYRDAYHSQLNDRYRGKWQEYRGLARWASELLFQVGIGYARDPIPEAEAPQLSAAIGALAAGTYFARTSWLNAAGEEGSAGKLASLDLTAGSCKRRR
ncbi:MAG: hypothetical protein HY013_08925 [Candidatus Solibacter usitatus]|nr:hypothetical protein [Candidatus Solibacter usitatus]